MPELLKEGEIRWQSLCLKEKGMWVFEGPPGLRGFLGTGQSQAKHNGSVTLSDISLMISAGKTELSLNYSQSLQVP